ncbi:jouberin-like [Pollicipes pollicipes]|uniref:jouberin-like n=1 Tax=Pollicipes pollicipes TaxID=41117 RepID=UPI001885029F|nr:jouberin-like [Pollicipes pollicipes]
MAASGDKQPLTVSDRNDGARTGIISRTKRRLSAVLREKPQILSNKSVKEDNSLRGWRNPSYEMTESKESGKVVGTTEKNSPRKGDVGREGIAIHTNARKRERPDAETKSVQEEHEMQEIDANRAEANVNMMEETGAGRDDGTPQTEHRSSGGQKSTRRDRKKPGGASRKQMGTNPSPADREAAGSSASAASDQVMGVIVHQCDRLDGRRWQLSRPMVRVHLIDTSSGEPVHKHDPQRRVTYFYEPDGVDTILPAMTQPSAPGGAGALLWDELLLFNEPFQHLTASEPRVCVMFELVSTQPELLTAAWAFLRLCGAGGRLNTEQRLRLQLFRPPADRALRLKPIYSWWRSGGRHKLPGTLHVTVKAVTPPALEPAPRSFFPTQPERSGGTAGSPEGNGRRAIRLADDAEACQALRFDGAGNRLACGVQRGAQFPVLVYAVESGARTHVLLGHGGLVYELRWADDRLLTASADWTARLWRLDDDGGHQALVLPHPGYVYAALFHLSTPRFVVTACFDGVVRVWKCSTRDAAAEPRLSEELATSAAPVNSLCCAPDGTRLYAGDASGQLTVWAWRASKGRPEVTLERRISPAELAGAPINQLELHPAGRRLFVQARHGVILALDTVHLVLLQTLTGHLNSRALLRGCLSPCGTYYISGSEDGCLHAWSTDTGERCAAYTALGSTRPVVSVHFHPWEHMLAAATHRDPCLTVLLLKHEREASGAALGLTLLPRAIQPAPAAADGITSLPQPTDREAEEEDRRFQAMIDRLDSVIAVARNSHDMSHLSVHSRRRQQRREQKRREAMSRTDPGI